MSAAGAGLCLLMLAGGFPLLADDCSLAGFARNDAAAEAPFVVSTNRPAFRAVHGSAWVPGMVPVFAVEKSGVWELRRHPGRGQEDFTDPIFFGLPAVDESVTASVAGRWEIQATRSDGSRLHLAVELSEHHGRVAGRFDQTTDYRFAQIAGGTATAERLELDVKYINDEYRLLTERSGDRWLGRWMRRDGTEGGELELHRNAVPCGVPAKAAPVALFEVRPPAGSSSPRRYLLADDPVPAGWTREERPLVRVWRATSP